MKEFALIEKGLTVIWLLWMTAWDLKEKKIPGYCMIVGLLPVIIGICINWPGQILAAISGFLLGGCFILLSVLTKGQIGKADGVILMLIGIMIGFYNLIEILCFCFIYLFIVAAVLLILRKKTKKQTLPFLPFLTAGYLSFILGTMGGFL